MSECLQQSRHQGRRPSPPDGHSFTGTRSPFPSKLSRSTPSSSSHANSYMHKLAASNLRSPTAEQPARLMPDRIDTRVEFDEEEDSDFGGDMTHYMHSEFRLGVVGIVFIIAGSLFFIVPSVIQRDPNVTTMSNYTLTGGILFGIGLLFICVNIVWCCNEERILRKAKVVIAQRAELKEQAKINQTLSPNQDVTKWLFTSLPPDVNQSKHEPGLPNNQSETNHSMGSSEQTTGSAVIVAGGGGDGKSALSTSDGDVRYGGEEDGGFRTYVPRGRRLCPVGGSESSERLASDWPRPISRETAGASSDPSVCDSNWYVNPNYLSDTQI